MNLSLLISVDDSIDVEAEIVVEIVNEDYMTPETGRLLSPKPLMTATRQLLPFWILSTLKVPCARKNPSRVRLEEDWEIVRDGDLVVDDEMLACVA
jgi:hypothetical protein